MEMCIIGTQEPERADGNNAKSKKTQHSQDKYIQLVEKGMHIVHTLSNKYFWFRKIHKYLKYSPLSSSILYLASPYRRGAIVGAV